MSEGSTAPDATQTDRLVRERNQALAEAQRATDLVEKYGNALIEIAKHLRVGTPGSIMRARTVIAGLDTAPDADA